LGHFRIVLTLNAYSHVLPDMHQQTVAHIEKFLFRKVGTL